MDKQVAKAKRRSPAATAVGCVGLLIVTAALGVTAFFLMTAVPPPDVNSRALPDPNGYDAVKAVVQSLTPSSSSSPVVQKGASPAALRAALAPDLSALGKMHDALELPYMSPPIRMSQIDHLAATNLFNPQVREGARKSTAMARLAKAEGRYGAAMDSALDAVALGVKVPRGGLIIDLLVGNACVAIGGNEAIRLVERLDAAELGAARHRLDELMSERVREADILAEERQMNLREARARRFDPQFRLMYRQIDQVFREAIKESVKPPALRQPPPSANTAFGTLIARTLPDVTKSLVKRDRLLAVLQTKIAVEEYRKAHRRLPESIDDLVPRFLSEPPKDPSSEKPFRYRRTGATYEIAPP